MIWLDSETYSEVDIKRGLFNYREGNMIPIIITYAFDDEPVQLWQHGEPLPKRLTDAIHAGELVYAHNANFDYLMLKDLLGLKLEQMRDTMAIASVNNLPESLKMMCEELGIDEGKLDSGTRLIKHFCTPNKEGERNLPVDHVEKWAEFCEYAIRDVEAMRSATKLCHPLSDYEQKVWELTQRINFRGVPVNVQSTKKFKDLAKEVKVYLNQDLEKLTGIDSASKTAKLLQWIKDQGVEIENLQAKTVQNLLKTDLPDNVRKALNIRKQASMTSPAKFDVIMRSAHEGRFKNAYVYHGASTGRYASRGGLNMQNLPRGSEEDAVSAYNHIKTLSGEDYVFFYDARIDPLSSVIRPTIEAPEGKKFINYDYSSIENRVAPFIAGDNEALDAFAKGLDEYKIFAQSIYHVDYEGVTKSMRQMAKSACLGSMFGAGAKGLQGYVEGYGIKIEIEEAQGLVNIYRETHAKIRNAWYAFGNKAMAAVKNRGKVYRLNRCAIIYDGRFLRLKLPSGRIIQWHKPEIRPNKTPWGEIKDAIFIRTKPREGKKWVWGQLIGSSIFQSVVQATARDMLVDAMLKLEEKGYKIVLTTHDEIQAEVDEDWANEAEFEQIMTTPPSWAEGFPLAVEGWSGKNYRK